MQFQKLCIKILCNPLMGHQTSFVSPNRIVATRTKSKIKSQEKWKIHDAEKAHKQHDQMNIPYCFSILHCSVRQH